MIGDFSTSDNGALHQDDGSLTNPDEFKDAPIRFSMVLDGRREEVKIVEPSLDIALPTDGRLLIHENDRCLHDLTFRFDNSADQPYRLHFGIENGISYTDDHVLAFGEPPPADKQLRCVYRKDLLERGGVAAWIEMTKGKARLFVEYG
jgi:hypothetical protein